jgi:hypothetical protein
MVLACFNPTAWFEFSSDLIWFHGVRALSHNDAVDLASVVITDANMPRRPTNLPFDHGDTLGNDNAFYLGVSLVIAPKAGRVLQRNAVPNLEKELRHGNLLKGNLPGEHPFPQTDAIGRRELAQGRFANA